MTDDKVIFINPTFEDLCRLHPELIDWRNSYIAACERADRAESQIAALTAELLASTQRMTAQSQELNAQHKTIQALQAALSTARKALREIAAKSVGQEIDRFGDGFDVWSIVFLSALSTETRAALQAAKITSPQEPPMGWTRDLPTISGWYWQSLKHALTGERFQFLVNVNVEHNVYSRAGWGWDSDDILWFGPVEVLPPPMGGKGK